MTISPDPEYSGDISLQYKLWRYPGFFVTVCVFFVLHIKSKKAKAVRWSALNWPICENWWFMVRVSPGQAVIYTKYGSYPARKQKLIKFTFIENWKLNFSIWKYFWYVGQSTKGLKYIFYILVLESMGMILGGSAFFENHSIFLLLIFAFE